jgi:D-alanyl-lipoteichoic acid acyltransferase DltB (MBOAT superfamily)
LSARAERRALLFNSYTFLLVFLPITYVGYFALARRSRNAAKWWLAAASLAFYSAWDIRFLPILVASILFNYAVGYRIGTTAEAGRKPKGWLWLGIAGDLAALGYFKYANFFVSSVNEVAGTQFSLAAIVLPLGISFFTFTQIAYLVDAYQGKAREYRFGDYVLFVTWFPHLIAGPILHHAQMMPQFNQPEAFRQDRLRFAVGMAVFAVGLFKKVGLADRVAPYADAVFHGAAHGTPLTTAEAWGGALAYVLQLYFDFSGYSDMAVGLSLLFGVKMPLNFASPLQSTSIIELWNRWHMTLGRFLRDYLYTPIAGIGRDQRKLVIGLVVTMFLGGLWHGANWTFAVFGVMQGVFLVINHFWRMKVTRPAKLKGVPAFLYDRAAHVLTLLAWVMSCVVFRSENVASAGRMVRAMFGGGVEMAAGAGTWLAAAFPHYPLNWRGGLVSMVVLAAIMLFGPSMIRMFRDYKPALATMRYEDPPTWYQWRPTWGWALWLGLLFATAFMMLSRTSVFLYFQF